MVCVCPGFKIEITPPQTHMSLELLFRAGKFPASTVGEPGAQGAGITGTQGAGANITGGGLIVAGLAGQLHIPKGGIFPIGLKSIIVPIGLDDTMTVVCALAMRVDGAAPKVHCIVAPVQAHIPIGSSPLNNN